MQRIELDATITDDEIKITSTCTSFVDLRNVEPVSFEDLRCNVKALARKLRENKVIFSRKGLRKVLDAADEYHAAMAEHRELFLKAKEMWTRINEEGIFCGYWNDERIKEANKVSWAMEEKWWRSAIASRVHDAAREVERYLNQDLTGFVRICI